MSKGITSEKAAFYLQDYIEEVRADGAFEKSRKFSAQSYIKHIIEHHVEPAKNDFKRNTEHNGQK